MKNLTRLAVLGVVSALALTACGSESDDASGGTTVVKLWLAGEKDTPEELTTWLEKEYDRLLNLFPGLYQALSNFDKSVLSFSDITYTGFNESIYIESEICELIFCNELPN